MKKVKFAIIGKPVSHSLSPTLHNYWFKKYNIQAEYELLNIEENKVKDVIESVKEKKIKGINVTLPYKRFVIPFLSKTVNDANETHSVNTVLLDDNSNLIGENTDVFGFQAAYLKSLPDSEKKNKKALILGAGGVAPSIIFSLIKSNITNISIVNRTYEKSLFLKNKFKEINVIKWENCSELLSKFDILINATSLGLNPNDDFNLSIQSGSSWVKTQQVTGVGRFLSEGYKYDYYQLNAFCWIQLRNYLKFLFFYIINFQYLHE